MLSLAGVEVRASVARRQAQPVDPRQPLPPGTSKWNKIEHRLFSFISINWRGRPLRTYETIVNLIGNTTNEADSSCARDWIAAAIDRQESLGQGLRKLKIEKDPFHGTGTTSSSRARDTVTTDLSSRALRIRMASRSSRSRNGSRGSTRSRQCIT